MGTCPDGVAIDEKNGIIWMWKKHHLAFPVGEGFFRKFSQPRDVDSVGVQALYVIFQHFWDAQYVVAQSAVLDFQYLDAWRDPKADFTTVFAAFADGRTHVALKLKQVTLQVEYVLGGNAKHGALLTSVDPFCKDVFTGSHVVLKMFHASDLIVLREQSDLECKYEQ